MRSVLLALTALLVATATALASPTQEPAPGPVETPADPGVPPDFAAIAWHRSRALGGPARKGRLVDGVQLPQLGEDFFTWDPVFNQIPDRPGRRWGTDELIRTVLTVLHGYRIDRDSAPRVGIMDLSRPRGGPFGRNFGGLGHSSHQNGLDADILYPLKDGTEARALDPSEVDRELAQDLVDRFVAAGATKVFVGPHLHLTGPRKVVIRLAHHDDHLHVRLPDQRTS